MKRGFFSGVFVALGTILPNRISLTSQIIGERISLGGFYKKYFLRSKIVRNRYQLIDIGTKVLETGRCSYLEFGVASGETFKYVVEKISNAKLEMHGFDTFEGLPESHHEFVLNGTFTADGQTPSIDDPRVNWHKGLFQETFNGNEEYLKFKKFIFMDADLYSSTRYVLKLLYPKLSDGDLIYFDDLHVPNQERLALIEFIGINPCLSLIARTWEGRSALFEFSEIKKMQLKAEK